MNTKQIDRIVTEPLSFKAVVTNLKMSPWANGIYVVRDQNGFVTIDSFPLVWTTARADAIRWFQRSAANQWLDAVVIIFNGITMAEYQRVIGPEYLPAAHLRPADENEPRSPAGGGNPTMTAQRCIITDEQWAETIAYCDAYRAFIRSIAACEDGPEPEDDNEAVQRIDATEDDWLWMR